MKMNRKIVFSIQVALLMFAVLSFGKNSKVNQQEAMKAEKSATPFPADVMKWTDSEKEKQRLAGTKLLEQIYAAVKNKQPVINIPRGIYRFRDTTVPQQPTHINLCDVKNFEIEGNGSWLYFERQASAFRFLRCDNVSLKNINIDYDPLPYVQGTVVKVYDKSPRFFTFKPDSGYAVPELLTTNSVNWRKSLRGHRRILLCDRKTGLLSSKIGMDISNKEIIKKLPNGTYKVPVWVWWGRSLKEAGIKEGTTVTVLKRAGRTIRIELCGKMVVDNVDVYAGGFVAYAGNYGKGPFIFRNCDIRLRPDTGRLMANNADGFNVSGTMKGTVIERCSAEAIGDDCVNLHGVYYKVFDQLSPTELIVARTPENDGQHPIWHFIAGNPWHDKDRPEYKAKTWAFIGKRKVLEQKRVKYTIPTERKMHDWAANKRYEVGKNYPALKVRLDAPIKVDGNTIFWSENAITKDSIIRNNVFRNNIARGIRLQTINTTVDTNKISLTTGYGLSLGGHPGFWGEGTNCRNITIRNNIFDNCGRIHGNAAVDMTVEGNPEEAEPIENICFENNQIINPGRSGIELLGCRNIRLINNVITGVKKLPYRKTYNPHFNVDLSMYAKPVVLGKGLKEIKVINTPSMLK